MQAPALPADIDAVEPVDTLALIPRLRRPADARARASVFAHPPDAPTRPDLPTRAHAEPEAALTGAAEGLPTTGSASPIASTASRPRWLKGRLDRAHRVLLTLIGVWVLNSFDLGFTLAEANSGHFVELNPIAATLLHQPPHVLALYKFGLLGLGTLILLGLRRHSVAELGCWFLLAACTYVTVRWYVYYDTLLTDVVTPITDALTTRH